MLEVAKMPNSISKYHNDLNTVPFRLWTVTEQNFFFGLLTQLKDKGTEEIIFSKSDLSEFADYTNRNSVDFVRTMKSLMSKLLNMHYIEQTSHSLKGMVLFDKFEVEFEADAKDRVTDIQLTLAVSKHFTYILNKLEQEFTLLDLPDFIRLKSTYSKTMYRYVSQWNKKGVIGGFLDGEVPKEQLFQLLEVPRSMQRANNFNDNVLKPIIKELSPLFEGFKIRPIKARKAGSPVIAYKISWKQIQKGTWVDDKFEKLPKKKIQPAPEWSNTKYVSEPLDEAEKALLIRKNRLMLKALNEGLSAAEQRELDNL
jgi:plasmid replication initiation protein